MRLLTSFALLLAVGAGSWWAYENQEHMRSIVGQYIENGEFLTFEARYTPEQIMDNHRSELLASNQHSFLEPILKFHPYLLMEVKYTQNDKKTREGVLLWSLVDGEMVLNTDTWEQSHGFEDAIIANASRTDFKILNALAKNNGVMTHEQLQYELKLEDDTIDPWIASTRKKHLVVQRGNTLQLHFQSPKILVSPQTKISQWLVTKPYNHVQRLPRKYSRAQVENVAKAAFGNDFTVRNAKEIFLPVYSLEVLNSPDGSVLSSFWNALNGKRINPKYIN